MDQELQHEVSTAIARSHEIRSALQQILEQQIAGTLDNAITRQKWKAAMASINHASYFL
jgi:hypothetical protein